MFKTNKFFSYCIYNVMIMRYINCIVLVFLNKKKFNILLKTINLVKIFFNLIMFSVK